MIPRMLRTGVPAVLLFCLSATAGVNPNVVARAALARTLPEANFSNSPLKDCLDFLQDTTGANLHANWKALEAAGVTADTAITMRLRNVSMRKVLTMLLSEANPKSKLTFFIEDGVIEITTQELADKNLIVKVYPVQDLLMEIPDFAPKVNFRLNGTGQRNQPAPAPPADQPMQQAVTPAPSGTGSESERYGSHAGQPKHQHQAPANVAPAAPQTPGDKLIALITDTVQPSVWKQNGGPASIRLWHGNLIISAPRSVHEAIGGPVD